MRIRKDTHSTANAAELFRGRLVNRINPVDAAAADENDLNNRLFESMFARIERLEAELEQREQARQGARPINTWLSGQVAFEQDTAQTPTKRLQNAIDAYDKTSRLNEENL